MTYCTAKITQRIRAGYFFYFCILSECKVADSNGSILNYDIRVRTVILIQHFVDIDKAILCIGKQSVLVRCVPKSPHTNINYRIRDNDFLKITAITKCARPYCFHAITQNNLFNSNLAFKSFISDCSTVYRYFL